MLYRSILKPILFRFDPEFVHDWFILLGEKLGGFRPAYALLDLIYGFSGRESGVTVDGLYYSTPVILGAGFDYNARLINVLPALSFGGVEVGSVTASPCQGNPKPRLMRLPKSQSILVNKGLRNDGVDVIIKRLQNKKQRKDFVVGVSIARSNVEQTASVEEGVSDYLESFKKLNQANVGDYFTLNISCPNAFGGETFAEPISLEKLLGAISEVPCDKPIYIKMPINLDWPSFDKLLQVIEKFKVSGVIIGNLNKDYSSLIVRAEAPEKYQGGLSGRPCFKLSNDLIRMTREKYGHRFTIIGSGGVFSPQDALEKLALGADLVQIVTGMIYEGPGLMKKIAKEYAKS
ncbi:MAG: quinone-dependent dihydroorotate dehydrogenase [Minisyncoccota bacterium]